MKNKTYSAPRLIEYGAVQDLTRNCNLNPSDVLGGVAGTACKSLS